MKSFFRFVLLCLCGGALVYSAWIMREGRNPQKAPPDVQLAGKVMLKEQLKKIRVTEFVKTPRGKELFNRVCFMLDQDKIVFTSDILGGEKALCKVDYLGGETWYIEVAKSDGGNYVHLQPHQLIEVAFHEALHSIKGGYNSASIQEECDAFVAGHQAEAASQGTEPQEVVTLENVPVARFVERNYIGISNMFNYKPVGESMEWLKQRSGL